jgi:hypothetical protein
MPIVIPKWAAHGVANWKELLIEAGNGQHDLNEATAAVLNYLPVIGITTLTQDTAGDAWCRIAILQALFGGLVKDSTSGKTYFITRSDVFRHIGVETEGKQQSFGEFCESLLPRAQLQFEGESPFFIANGRRSLLEVCGVAEPSAGGERE